MRQLAALSNQLGGGCCACCPAWVAQRGAVIQLCSRISFSLHHLPSAGAVMLVVLLILIRRVLARQRRHATKLT